MHEHDDPDRLATYFRAESPEKVTASPEDAIVVDVPEESRYELRLGDRAIGFANYRLRRDGRIVVTHTEIDEECEGRGFGSRLAAGVLADVRRRGLEVTPLCPFLARYIVLHPEFHDLVAERHQGAFRQ
jgi:predicted GNAT family acetyltransferase